MPSKSTVWRFIDGWRRDGTIDRVRDLLRSKVRVAEKPGHARTTASVDSQSVDTTSGSEERVRDNGKNVDGRNRHVVVGSMGLMMAVPVTAASDDNGRAVTELFARLEGQPVSRVRRIFADLKYYNIALYRSVGANADRKMTIISRTEDKEGWVELPIRWTLGRTLVWLGRSQRLSNGREQSVRSLGSFVNLATIQLRRRRLKSSGADPKSCYRRQKAA